MKPTVTVTLILFPGPWGGIESQKASLYCVKCWPKREAYLLKKIGMEKKKPSGVAGRKQVSDLLLSLHYIHSHTLPQTRTHTPIHVHTRTHTLAHPSSNPYIHSHTRLLGLTVTLPSFQHLVYVHVHAHSEWQVQMWFHNAQADKSP